LPEPKERVRVTMTKEGDLRFLSHLDVVRALKRAFTRAGVPAAMTQGFNPQIHLVFLAPLPVGVASRCEVFHFELDAPMAKDDVARRLGAALPAGLRIVSAETDPFPRVRHFESLFSVEPDGETFPRPDDVRAFLGRDTAPVLRRLGPSASPRAERRSIDVRPFVRDARIAAEGVLETWIRTLDGRTVRAEDAVAAMAGEAARDSVGLVTKLEWRAIPDAEADALLSRLSPSDPAGNGEDRAPAGGADGEAGGAPDR
jgi:radical SAM-linked protein